MAVLDLIGFIVVVLVLWFIVSQMLKPALRGTLLFPMFRKEHALQAKILEQRQKFVEQRLEQDVAQNDQLLQPSPTDDVEVSTNPTKKESN